MPVHASRHGGGQGMDVRGWVGHSLMMRAMGCGEVAWEEEDCRGSALCVSKNTYGAQGSAQNSGSERLSDTRDSTAKALPASSMQLHARRGTAAMQSCDDACKALLRSSHAVVRRCMQFHVRWLRQCAVQSCDDAHKALLRSCPAGAFRDTAKDGCAFPSCPAT